MMNLHTAIGNTLLHFVEHAGQTNNARWQGMDVSAKPEMRMHEVTHIHFEADMDSSHLDHYRLLVRPNLPWADEHFERERVSGDPINPGTTWTTWPYGLAADKHRDEGGQFNHSYAERYWPRYAGQYPEGHVPPGVREGKLPSVPHHGIRHTYGDLAGVVRTLVKDPTTRQAYLPVWFPEDTGDAHQGRKPCTIGYHFLMRNGQLDVFYHIRSCDILRHFRDDIYLTVRLVLWVLDECRKLDRLWGRIQPGTFIMHMGSLHCFRNDWPVMQQQAAEWSA